MQVKNVLTTAECDRIIAAAEQMGFKNQRSRGAAFGEAFRDNDRIQVEDPKYADMLWRNTGMSSACAAFTSKGKAAIGLSSNIRIYRYGKGQKFGKHVDDSVQLADSAHTGYTVLVYLTTSIKAVPNSNQEPCLQGGETVFYDERGRKLAEVVPLAGMALLHLHGDDCLEHEGAEVRSGTKYVLRTDVVFQ